MLTPRGLAAFVSTLVLATACSDGTGPSVQPTTDCSAASMQTLAPGQFVNLNPSTQGSCVRVSAAGAGGAQYLYAALATAGEEKPDGVKASYRLSGGAPTAGPTMRAASPLPDPRLAALRGPVSASEFHLSLREHERELSQGPAVMFRAAAGQQRSLAVAGGAGASTGTKAGSDRTVEGISPAVTPPPVGDKRTFHVCATRTCRPTNASDFVEVTATARHVGQRVAIYVDTAAPADGYTPSELVTVGELFDSQLYPIDIAAFGSESDVDSNGVVIVLLTPRVNQLSEDCSKSVILGYFFGLDLFPGEANSNGGEVFYGLVPGITPNCNISTEYANRNLPPTFIHEFQHMINFNQHVLLRNSFVSEDVWLNEGLSHYAEELGARKILEADCVDTDCYTQFMGGNFSNAYNYLLNPEEHFLVAPGISGGSLAERGAAWLFIRWLVDQFGEDVYGANVTRALVNTRLIGAANIENVVKQPFSSLVPAWQMANYLDDLDGFSSPSSLFQYSSWNLRQVFDSMHVQQRSQFPLAYPLEPEQVGTSSFSIIGTLRAGSGRHLLITQPPSSGEVEVRLTGPDGQALPPATIAPRIALLRIR